jgi:hypothetical protein
VLIDGSVLLVPVFTFSSCRSVFAQIGLRDVVSRRFNRYQLSTPTRGAET